MTDASIAEKVIWGLALLALIPALFNPAGWMFAILLALGILAVGYGVRWLYGTSQARRQGERGRVKQARDRGGNERFRR